MLAMRHDPVRSRFRRQQAFRSDPSIFGHLFPFMEGTGWTDDLVAT